MNDTLVRNNDESVVHIHRCMKIADCSQKLSGEISIKYAFWDHEHVVIEIVLQISHVLIIDVDKEREKRKEWEPRADQAYDVSHDENSNL